MLTEVQTSDAEVAAFVAGLQKMLLRTAKPVEKYYFGEIRLGYAIGAAVGRSVDPLNYQGPEISVPSTK